MGLYLGFVKKIQYSREIQKAIYSSAFSLISQSTKAELYLH